MDMAFPSSDWIQKYDNVNTSGDTTIKQDDQRLHQCLHERPWFHCLQAHGRLNQQNKGIFFTNISDYYVPNKRPDRSSKRR